MKTRLVAFGVTLAVALAAAAVFMACDLEVDSATSPIRITPSMVELDRGQSQEFVATGGYDYFWEIEESKRTWGLLDASTGDRVVYTSRHQPQGADQVVVLKVTSTIIGQGQTTNGATAQGTAEAYIIHEGSGTNTTGATTTTTTTTTPVTTTTTTTFVGDSNGGTNDGLPPLPTA